MKVEIVGLIIAYLHGVIALLICIITTLIAILWHSDEEVYLDSYEWLTFCLYVTTCPYTLYLINGVMKKISRHIFLYLVAQTFIHVMFVINCVVFFILPHGLDRNDIINETVRCFFMSIIIYIIWCTYNKIKKQEQLKGKVEKIPLPPWKPFKLRICNDEQTEDNRNLEGIVIKDKRRTRKNFITINKKRYVIRKPRRTYYSGPRDAATRRAQGNANMYSRNIRNPPSRPPNRPPPQLGESSRYTPGTGNK